MISLFFLGFLLLMVLWNLYYTSHWSKNLTVSLHFLQNFVYAGEQAQMTEQIENRKRLFLPVLEVAFHMDRRLVFLDCENTNVSDFVYKRDIFALLGSQRVTRTLSLRCTGRGYYRIDESRLTTYSLLHTGRCSADCPAETELYVYAARTDVSDILISCERLMGSLQCTKRLFEDPFAFSSIREYTPTDPMNTINWKASARTGELMVNTFESTLTEKVMLFLDLEDSGILKEDHLIEDSVSTAASLAQRMLVRGMEVGICVNTDCAASDDKNAAGSHTASVTDGNMPRITYIAPSGGRRQLESIERLLARCKSCDRPLPFPSLPNETDGRSKNGHMPSSSDWPEDAVLILISKNAAQRPAVMEAFAGGEREAILVVPCTKNNACDIKTPANIHLIRREVERS